MVELKQNAYAQSQSTAIDAGLREYMMKVYNYMTSGLAISGLVAWGFSQSCLLYTSPSPRDRQKSRMPSSA